MIAVVKKNISGLSSTGAECIEHNVKIELKPNIKPIKNRKPNQSHKPQAATAVFLTVTSTIS